ncbi:MAG: proline dehydrogenase family protein [Cyclonatronaceae bacterium]
MRLPFFLASRFVAGEDLSAAVPKVKELNEKGIAVTLDLLGENVTKRETADATTREYCDLLEGIRHDGLDASISIKLTMLGLDIDTEYCRQNLHALLDKARELDQFVRIDMEGSDYTQRTMDLFFDARKEYGQHVGIVIQAYLHRSRKDIEALSKNGADVRLCKGAYNEPASLALKNMADIRAVFKEYASKLLHSTDNTRIATHDDHLIEWTKQHAQEYRISRDKFEFQLLYGLRLSTCEQLVQEGYRVRVYVPYGTMWLPYFSRRLRERKENIWFILTNMIKK